MHNARCAIHVEQLAMQASHLPGGFLSPKPLNPPALPESV